MPFPSIRTDHLVYAVPELAAAVERIAAEWGVRPALGGQHPNGTHNALLALGPHTYLEIIAPDPAQPNPALPRSFGIDERPGETRLVTWAAATSDLDATRATALSQGYDAGEVMAGSRLRPDGVKIAWRSTRLVPSGRGWPPPGDGLVPFLIEWGPGTPHPSTTSPGGCTLVGLRAEHPDPAAIHQMLAALGLDIAVSAGPAPALYAVIDTPKGRVELA
ncbi:MAG: VOC family protein [Chloroflexi bacterium]|nr:VOC family protein [Chloroflexota bacterium]